MVKGLSKQVVVLRPDSSSSFEQIILLLKDNQNERVNEAQLLAEANAIALDYHAHEYRRQRGVKAHPWAARAAFSVVGLLIGAVIFGLLL